MGACGGFTLATVLTVSLALSVPQGTWWEAVVQVHGHLQLYGWAGLFVLGVLLYFFPRLCGAPLAGMRFVLWLLSTLVSGLIVRAISQPFFAATQAPLWQVALISSGILETAALAGILSVIGITAFRGSGPKTRPAYFSVLPLFLGATCSLGIAILVNFFNILQAAQGSGLVNPEGDTINVTLGLFGFLVPVALAMSARSLPMYAGLDGFPRRVLWPLALVYFLGLALLTIGNAMGLPPYWAGLGMALIGGVMLFFVGTFLRLMSKRGRLPERVAQLAPEPKERQGNYQRRVKKEQGQYGPFVGLVASAYLWALIGALFLLIDGIGTLTTGTALFAIDAIRHSFALGFIALLICGIAPRMLPSFSGHQIVSPRLVSATLWLGNIAAVLRVGSTLLAPFFPDLSGSLWSWLLGLSGPCGLALAICLAINLWPTLSAPSEH